MNKLLVGTAALAAVALVNSSFAADLPAAPVYKAPVMAPVYSWTGCYVGGNVGGKWARTSGSADLPGATGPGGTSPASSFALGDNSNAGTVIGGGQVGCNYQTGALVFGVEGDADWQRWSTSRVTGAVVPALFVPGDVFDVSSRWQASVRGRVGYAWDKVLLYATGGVAFTDVQVGSNFIPFGIFPGTLATDRQALVGATAGAGLEYALGNNLSLGIEGRYTWYGTHTFNAGQVATFGGPGGPFTFAAATQTIRLNTAEVLAKLNWKIW